VGHTHVTIQKISDTNFNPTTPPDATTFAFFKGINDAGDGQGDLSADVTSGLPAVGHFLVVLVGGGSNEVVLGILPCVHNDFGQ
jgi:transcription initiation factor TFIID subunit 15